VSFFLLYFFLLKATVTSFSGLSSLPVIQADLVVRHHVITDKQLNTAVAAGRTGPGPVGLYVVSVGYLAAGPWGALAGYLAVVTPAFLVVPILKLLGRRTEQPAVRRAIRGILLSAAGLMLSSSLPLGRASLNDGVAIAMALASFGVLAFTRVDTLWVIVCAAAAGAAMGLLR
jgi:chromate transporter